MSHVMFEFMCRMLLCLAIFLVMSYFLFRHIEKVKQVHGSPKADEKQTPYDIFKHYFFKRKQETK